MIKLIVAILVGKIIYFLSRLLKVGGGSAAPGLHALKIEPKLVEKLTKKLAQNIIITGTNGKTTTARLLTHFLANFPLKLIRNQTGSNLERGVASALINRANIFGQIKADLGIWELDEAAFNKVLFQIKPQIIVFLNAFRDQLDRYGEVDSVVKAWQESLNRVDWQPVVIVNGSDANTASLTKASSVRKSVFSVKNHRYFGEKALHKLKPPKSDFLAKIDQIKGLGGTDLTLIFPGGAISLTLWVPGIYHVYDLLAAFATYYHLNLDLSLIKKSLASYTPAFGRVEKVNLGNTQAYIFLIKNPAGASLVFETIGPHIKPNDRLLMVLNDNFADGTDISWIWDAEFEKLKVQSAKLKVICSGKRAQDLAVRLKYAGFNPGLISVENNLKQALEAPNRGLKGRLFILPTYTAMLQLQKILTKMGIKEHYWKEE